MPARIPDDERERIIAEFATGKSCNQIAKQFGRSSNTISRIAKSVGHQFAQVNAVHAREVKAVYDSERRAGLIASSIDAAERMFKQMFSPALVYNFGGKDNTYNEHMVSEPSFRDKRDIAATIATMVRTATELQKLENAAGTDDLLQEFIDAIAQRRAHRQQDDHDPL